MIRRLLPCCAVLLAPLAQAAELDEKALYKHIQKTFNAPAEIEFSLKGLAPSKIPGFLAGELQSSYRGNTRNQPILVSSDGRHYVLSDIYELEPSKQFKDLSASRPAEGIPAVHVSSDLKYFFMGDLRDLSVDPDAVNMSKIQLSGALSRGSNSAPVTVVEFSDLQCPYCRNAHMALEENLLKTYGKKVRWVFKHFPLTSIHPWAYPAAIATSCAALQSQEAAWKLEALIFQDQEKLNTSNFKEKALEHAKKVGLKAQPFENCFDKQETKPAVEADMQEARNLQVNSTPTFFVNGRQIAGFRNFDSIKTLIDQMLSEKDAEKSKAR